MNPTNVTVGAEADASLPPDWRFLEDPVLLTISQAARACGVNRRTIRRHREAGDFPGACKDEEGVWRILVSDLGAAGYAPYLLGRLDESAEATQLDKLRTEVAVLRERLHAVETIARERGERIADLRLVLRMLPGPGEAATPLKELAAARSAGVLPRALESRVGTPSPQRGVVLASGAAATMTKTELADPLIWLPDRPPTGSPKASRDHPTPPPFPDTPDPVADPPPPALPGEPRRWRLGWLPWRRDRE